MTSVFKIAFNCCFKIETVYVPGSVKTIESGAFANCLSLKEVFIEEGVESIGRKNTGISGAFTACQKLKKIVIPETVTYIEDNAFEWTKDVTIYGVLNSYAQQYAVKKGIPFVEI